MVRETHTPVVRTGPVSVLALLMVLCLATLSVLTLTTARANDVAAAKQLQHVQDVYANEVRGQEFLSALDAALSRAGSVGNAASLDAVARANEATLLPDNVLEAHFDNGGSQLTVRVEVRPDGTWHVIQWKVESAAALTQQEEPRLWGGTG